MASIYPLPQSHKENLDAWLDTLTVVTPTNTPEARPRICPYCEETTFGWWAPDELPSNIRDPATSTVSLPCGCQIHRGCAIQMVHPEEDDGNECLLCHFMIFEESDDNEDSDDTERSDLVEEFVNTLRRLSIISIEAEGLDKECSICRNEYNTPNTDDPDDPTAEIEHPVRLPCNHVFGNHCLLRWLSQDEDVEPTCPTCRREVVIPLSPEDARELRTLLDRENIVLRERVYWQRYWASHRQVLNPETADEMEDKAWLDAQVESTVANISEWINETLRQMCERRASIREAFLDRVMDRTRARLGWAAARLIDVEMTETRGAWEEAADDARWYGLPGFE